MKVGEVAKLLNLPKQRIHEYEKAGIALQHDPAHAFEYSEDDIERLWMIKFYKELDYTVPQMKKIFLDPQYDANLELAVQIEKLKEKKKEYEEMIERAELYRKTGLTAGSLFSAIPAIRERPYLAAQSILQNLAKIMNTFDRNDPAEEQADMAENTDSEIRLLTPENLPQVIKYDSEAKRIDFNLDTLLEGANGEEDFDQLKKLLCKDDTLKKLAISTVRGYVYNLILSKAKNAIERDKQLSKKKMDETSIQKMAESVANELTEEMCRELLQMLIGAFDELSSKMTSE